MPFEFLLSMLNKRSELTGDGEETVLSVAELADVEEDQEESTS